MKKIIIFISTILILGILAMITCIQNSKRIEQEKQNTVTTGSETIDNSIIGKNETQNGNEKEQKQTEENDINKEIENKNQEIKILEKEINQSIQSTNKKSEIKDKVETNKITINNKQETSSNNTAKTEKEETIQNNKETENTDTQIKKEEYKRNNEMIEKIRKTIENNITEDMKKYGYSIIVDSSIKELTNQFTYTENRVKNKIAWKFGEIRIYAEDYYCNGQLIMTECYII